MANFVKWRGPFLDEGSPSISKTIQYVEVGQAYRFGLYGGSGLTVGPNNPAIAQMNPRCSVESSSNNITWYELIGLQDMAVMVEARNPGDNAVWDYFQLVVKPRSFKVRPAVRGISYDYQVDTTKIGPNWNASMILTLRIALVPVNGQGSPPQMADTNGVVFATKPWTNTVWGAWTNRFKWVVESKWSEKFWLASPAGLSELETTDHKDGSRYRVHLHCVLRVVIVPPGPTAHHRVPVVQATQTVPPGPVIVNSTTVTFRSNSTLLDDKDIQTDSGLFAGSTTRPFNTATHEVGHLLGLFHPFQFNSAASLPGNSAYCVVGNPDCSLVMGLGDALQPAYAAPWQNAAAAWFNSQQKGYNLKPSDFKPSIFRLAPADI
jgi:hypothetical protein